MGKARSINLTTDEETGLYIKHSERDSSISFSGINGGETDVYLSPRQTDIFLDWATKLQAKLALSPGTKRRSLRLKSIESDEVKFSHSIRTGETTITADDDFDNSCVVLSERQTAIFLGWVSLLKAKLS